jgi:adenosylhomocysteine nucleosidase
MTIGIMAALHDEIAGLIALIAGQPGSSVERVANRDFHIGQIDGTPCVVVLAGVGKVAASCTATLLIQKFKVTEIIFSGLAGGLATHVKVGDIVIADQLMQHDMDARPLFPRFEIPLTGITHFETPKPHRKRVFESASAFLNGGFQTAIPVAIAEQYALHQPRIHTGLIISGDQFVGSVEASDQLRQIAPSALAVEMEGAAVAQVCHDFKLPYVIIRTVSDRADATAHIDFSQFLTDVASKYSAAILLDYVRH